MFSIEAVSKGDAQRARLCAGGELVFRQPGGQAVWVIDV